MARTVSTVQTNTIAAGVVPTYIAAAGVGANNGNYFVYQPLVNLHVKNGSGVTITVTIKSNGALVSGIAQTDKVYSITTTNAEMIIPPLDPRYFADATNNVNFDWSATTTVTFSLVTPYPTLS